MNYYRKTVSNVVDNVELKMQTSAFTLKLSENINKINDLLEVDKNIKKLKKILLVIRIRLLV